ncbi:MAG: energy transducer TonB [Alphaproteobacteria bacterium]
MLSLHRSSYAQRTAASDVVAASFVAALHTAGFWAVQHYAPAQEIIPVTPGMMFSLVMAEQKVAQPPMPVPPQPKRQPPKPKRAQLAAIARTPAVNTAPPPPVALSRPVVISAPAPVAPLPVTPPDVMAAYADNPLPQYPAISRRHGEEGKLMVRVCVKADGSVGSATNIRSSGFARLDKAAVAALLQWRFRPARRGTQPIEGCVDVPWVWSLRT